MGHVTRQHSKPSCVSICGIWFRVTVCASGALRTRPLFTLPLPLPLPQLPSVVRKSAPLTGDQPRSSSATELLRDTLYRSAAVVCGGNSRASPPRGRPKGGGVADSCANECPAVNGHRTLEELLKASVNSNPEEMDSSFVPDVTSFAYGSPRGTGALV
jgi:hypothetical protein